MDLFSEEQKAFEEYAEAAGETAVYADHLTGPHITGEGSPMAEVRFGYLIAGLNDEAQEVLDSINGGWLFTGLDGTTGEVGDVLWYNARLATRLAEQHDLPKMSFRMTSRKDKNPASPFQSALSMAQKVRRLAGEVSGKVKKIVRNDDNARQKAESAARILLEMRDVLHALAVECGRENGIYAVASSNLEKLQSRQDRGVLKGDGDAR